MAKEKISRSADICSYVDNDDTYFDIDFSLPGVKKEDISLKLQEDSLFRSAPRDDISR